MGNFPFIQKRMNRPGSPTIVEIIKKFPQPTNSTTNPEGADKKVLAKPIIDESNAYWVPEYSFLQRTDKYATNAADPNPPEKFSPATVKRRKLKSEPTLFKTT